MISSDNKTVLAFYFLILEIFFLISGQLTFKGTLSRYDCKWPVMWQWNTRSCCPSSSRHSAVIFHFGRSVEVTRYCLQDMSKQRFDFIIMWYLLSAVMLAHNPCHYKLVIFIFIFYYLYMPSSKILAFLITRSDCISVFTFTVFVFNLNCLAELIHFLCAWFLYVLTSRLSRMITLVIISALIGFASTKPCGK